MNEQIGWSVESKLLRYILKQLDRLAGLISNWTSTSISCTDVPACEEDPVFTAWLGATPPLYDLSGDTTPQLGGDLDVNGKSIDWGAVISTNTTYKGDTLSVTVDTNSVGFGCLLAQGADFHFDEADASAVTTTKMLVMALETGTGTKKVFTRGQICNTAWNWSSGPIYASETLGLLTQTPPITEDAVVVVVGWALSADTMFFSPYNAWITVVQGTTTTTTTTP